MKKVIALITDFGISDPYAGIMKGVIKSVDSSIDIIDISHNVEFANILHACFFLESSYKYFPKGTIFVVVVDPGVGTDRRPIVCKYNDKLFIAPDNGCLTPVFKSEGESEVRIIEKASLKLPEVSKTFHGRDIFAPAAAHFAAGADFQSAGRSIADPVEIEYNQCIRNNDSIQMQVRHVDIFGNVITNIPVSLKDEITDMNMVITKNNQPLGFAETFSSLDEGNTALIAGSAGYFEIVMNRESAADYLNIRTGDNLIIRYTGGA